MPLVTVIGRGHSGTRAVSHTLYASGVYMGSTINKSGDKVPPDLMYDACRIFARYVKWNGDLSWDFSQVMEGPIDPEFTSLIEKYLADVLEGGEKGLKGWKIPETTLVFPWIVRMFPDIKYIHLVRDPRDCILSGHATDDLGDFGIEYQATDDTRKRRAISWQYQYELVEATPKPANWLTIRFEDLVLKQEHTVDRMEEFLNMKLARIIMRPESVDRWRKDDSVHMFDCFRDAMATHGYELE